MPSARPPRSQGGFARRPMRPFGGPLGPPQGLCKSPSATAARPSWSGRGARRVVRAFGPVRGPGSASRQITPGARRECPAGLRPYRRTARSGWAFGPADSTAAGRSYGPTEAGVGSRLRRRPSRRSLGRYAPSVRLEGRGHDPFGVGSPPSEESPLLRKGRLRRTGRSWWDGDVPPRYARRDVSVRRRTSSLAGLLLRSRPARSSGAGPKGPASDPSGRAQHLRCWAFTP